MRYRALSHTIHIIIKHIIINAHGQPYTSSEFYNATIYVFDSPSDANDFYADYSVLGGFNQEFVLKKDDLDKIREFLK